MRWSLLGLIMVFPLLLGGMPKLEDAGKVVFLYGGAETLDIIKHPDKVEACPLIDLQPEDSRLAFEKKYREGDWQVVPEPEAKLLSLALLQPGNYGWDYVKACRPVYHNRLRFTKGQDTLDIDFCFSCDILRISKNGKELGGKDFQTPTYLRVMQKLFPQDKALQKVGK